MRTYPSNTELAGWGQFVNAASPVFQIGPYGTSAGVLVNQIAFSNSPPENRVKALLRLFWGEQPRGKLFPQNVRLAFMVLSLAKSTDPDMISLRDEIIAELRKRQHSDGSWSDAVAHPTAPAGGQEDATAWIVLALSRTNREDPAAHAGAEWLSSRVQGSGSVQLLSPIATAAAILAHPQPATKAELRRKGFEILNDKSVTKEELISFFDYEESSEAGSEQKRDYLCYPAFYSISLLINGLARGASFRESVQLKIFRSDAIQRLIAMTSGEPYKLPGARFASTVDQAIYALSYEQLAEAEQMRSKPASLFAPAYKWAEHSLITRLVLPIIVLIFAVVTVNDPTTVPSAIKLITGPSADPTIDFANNYKPAIQLLTALFLAIMPGIPKTGISLFRKRFFGS